MGSSSRKRSSRNKSSELSSQARKMKKSSRTKSKKHGRRSDCYSSNPDDDSVSSTSASTSSSEGTYRRRKKLSGARDNLKKRRKRARRRFSSSESSGELAQMRKRKRSKKDIDSKARAKSHRKKSRRDASISSASSDSHSCSTCKSGSSSDGEESERESVRRKSRSKKKDRNLRRDKHRTKMSIRRSLSHSSYSRSRDQISSPNHSEEKFLSENNSRHLRSVITFPEQTSEGEGNKWERNLHNEEIFYDHDDYTFRSSSGGGSKRESTPHSPPEFGGEKRTESRVKFVSDHEVTERSGSVNDAYEQYVSNTFLNEVETQSSAMESKDNIPHNDSGLSADDLETILRQKALQNLKKFRGGNKNNINSTGDQKNKDDGDTNPSTTATPEITQSRLPKQGPLTEVERDASDEGQAGKVFEIGKHNTNNQPDESALSGNQGHPVVSKSVTGNSSFWGRSSGLSLNRTTRSGASPDKNLRETERKEGKTSVGNTISLAGSSSFRGRSSGLDTLNKNATSVASPDKTLMETERSEGKTEVKTTQSVSPSTGITKGTASCSATIEPASCATSGGQSLNNQKDEAKDGEQYQQKTMSVMRGGEMVQVNYKVYIPQRAPALARRQLKR